MPENENIQKKNTSNLKSLKLAFNIAPGFKDTRRNQIYIFFYTFFLKYKTIEIMAPSIKAMAAAAPKNNTIEASNWH